MAILELYGKCRELGYCDCGGRYSCVDDEKPIRAPRDAKEFHKLAGKRLYTHSALLGDLKC